MLLSSSSSSFSFSRRRRVKEKNVQICVDRDERRAHSRLDEEIDESAKQEEPEREEEERRAPASVQHNQSTVQSLEHGCSSS